MILALIRDSVKSLIPKYTNLTNHTNLTNYTNHTNLTNYTNPTNLSKATINTWLRTRMRYVRIPTQTLHKLFLKNPSNLLSFSLSHKAPATTHGSGHPVFLELPYLT